MHKKLREHIAKIVPLGNEEFVFVSTHFITKKFRKHQCQIQEGEPVKYHFLIISGLLKLVYTDDTGKQHIVSFAMEYWWESDFYAYYTQTWEAGYKGLFFNNNLYANADVYLSRFSNFIVCWFQSIAR